MRVPPHLHTVAGAAYVLTQAPGRMKPKEIAITIAQRKSQEAAAAAGQARMLALERKAAAAATAGAEDWDAAREDGREQGVARPKSAFDDESDDALPQQQASPLQAAAGDLQRWQPARNTASPGRAQQRSPPRQSRAPPPRPAAPPLHSVGVRAVVSAELSSSPLYALLQDPRSLTGTFDLAPLIAALESTPPHEPLRSGCPGLDDLANGWLADANATASGEPAPQRAKPAALAASVDPRVLRQSLFQHAIADIASRERAVAFSSQDRLGETQLSPGEVEEVRGALGGATRTSHRLSPSLPAADPRPALGPPAARAPRRRPGEPHAAAGPRRPRRGRVRLAAPARAPRACPAPVRRAHGGPAPRASGCDCICVGCPAVLQRGALGAVRAEARCGGRLPRCRDGAHFPAARGAAPAPPPHGVAAGAAGGLGRESPGVQPCPPSLPATHPDASSFPRRRRPRRVCVPR